MNCSCSLGCFKKHKGMADLSREVAACIIKGKTNLVMFDKGNIYVLCFLVALEQNLQVCNHSIAGCSGTQFVVWEWLPEVQNASCYLVL